MQWYMKVRIGSEQRSDEVKTWVSGATKGRLQVTSTSLRNGRIPLRGISVGVERAAEIQAIVPSASAYVQKFNSTPILSKENGAYQIREFFDVASDAKSPLRDESGACKDTDYVPE